MGKVEGLDHDGEDGMVGGWQWEHKSQGLHCAGRGWHPEMGNKELKLPCKGQEWGKALLMRDDEVAGLRPWTLAA